MNLNAAKTEIINILINHLHTYDEPVALNDDIHIAPSVLVKFLGIHIDNHLNFSSHIDSIISSCNSRLFLLRQLKVLGMNTNGLFKYYCANIRFLATYAAPAWFLLLNDCDIVRLERIQRSATRTILPDLCYEERLEFLNLSSLHDFILDQSKRHFVKIADDQTHPLFNRIFRNECRTSSRCKTIFRPKLCRSQKRAKSFFPFFMTHFNNLRS